MNYEQREASLRVIGISAALLAFWIAGSLVVAAVVYRGRYEEPRTWLRQTSFTGGFTEHLGILDDRAGVVSDAEMRLHAYGWVDHPAGVARIPIERAMAIIAEKGLPPEPANATPTTISGGQRAATKEGSR